MITIRPATSQDLHGIWLLNSTYVFPPQAELDLQLVLKKGKAWVAEDTAYNGDMVAAIVGKIKFEVPYIHSVVTDHLHRKQGLATKLFTALEDGFTGGQYWLQVDAENPAQKLYFDLGYRVGGFDENFYGRGKHALCMYKSLKV